METKAIKRITITDISDGEIGPMGLTGEQGEKGETGSSGETGVGVSNVYTFYQSSTELNIPAVPTSITTLPPEGWFADEPDPTPNVTSYLYVLGLTIFTDGTYQYTSVSTSATYKAVNALADRLYEAEQTIKPESIITTVTESNTYINDLGEKVTEEEAATISQSASNVKIGLNNISDRFVFDADGFRMKDDDSKTIMEQDTDGNLMITGDYTQKGTYGNAVVLKDSRITFYDSADPTNATSPKNMGEIRTAHIDNEYGDDTEILSVQGNGHIRVLAQDSNMFGTASLQAGDAGISGAGIYAIANSYGSSAYMQDGNPMILSGAIIEVNYNSSTNVSSVMTRKGCTYGTLTAQNSWNISDTKISKNNFGNFVCLNLIASHVGTTSAQEVIATIPLDYRPITTIKEITFEASGGQLIEVQVTNTGNILAWSGLTNTNTNYVYVNILYPTET